MEKTLKEKRRVKTVGEEDILELDAIIITHPDNDHIGGIKRLIKKYTIKCPIITTEETDITNADLTTEIPNLGVELKYPTAGPRVYNNIVKNESKINKTIKKKSSNDSNTKEDASSVESSSLSANDAGATSGNDSKKEQDRLNESSILFSIGNVQLTGDSKGKLIHEATGLGKKEDLTKNVTVFQVPHHGSNENSFIPGEAVPAITGDDPLHDIKGKHPAYKYALFYRGIQARTYFISNGFNKRLKHPRKDVVTGILIAATTEKKKCNLVVTGPFYKDKIDYPKTNKDQVQYTDQNVFPGFPTNWKEYVDILVPKDGEDTPYITITGDGKEVTNTKPWVPEQPR